MGTDSFLGRFGDLLLGAPLAHVVIFSQLLAESKKVGMLYAVPFAFIETLFLQLLLPALERQLFGVSKKESH